MRRIRLAGAVLAAAVVAGAGAAWAVEGPSTLTGCLTEGGTITKVALGDDPVRACSATESEVRIADTDTTYGAGHGLTLTGTTFAVEEDQLSLPWLNLVGVPSDIADGDADTTYDGGDFAVSGQSCPPSQFVTEIDASGGLVCSEITTIAAHGSTITLSPTGIVIEGPTGSTVTLDATGVKVVGSVVHLNGSCAGVARVGDQTTGNQAAQHITSGSQSVMAC